MYLGCKHIISWLWSFSAHVIDLHIFILMWGCSAIGKCWLNTVYFFLKTCIHNAFAKDLFHFEFSNTPMIAHSFPATCENGQHNWTLDISFLSWHSSLQCSHHLSLGILSTLSKSSLDFGTNYSAMGTQGLLSTPGWLWGGGLCSIGEVCSVLCRSPWSLEKPHFVLRSTLLVFAWKPEVGF